MTPPPESHLAVYGETPDATAAAAEAHLQFSRVSIVAHQLETDPYPTLIRGTMTGRWLYDQLRPDEQAYTSHEELAPQAEAINDSNLRLAYLAISESANSTAVTHGEYTSPTSDQSLAVGFDQATWRAAPGTTEDGRALTVEAVDLVRARDLGTVTRYQVTLDEPDRKQVVAVTKAEDTVIDVRQDYYTHDAAGLLVQADQLLVGIPTELVQLIAGSADELQTHRIMQSIRNNGRGDVELIFLEKFATQVERHAHEVRLARARTDEFGAHRPTPDELNTVLETIETASMQ